MKRSRAKHRQLTEEGSRTWLAAECVEGLRTRTGERIYDELGCPVGMTRGHFLGLLRQMKIFRWLDRMKFDSFIDVASGFQHYPWLVAERYGAAAYYCDFVHDWNLPFDVPQFGKRDHAVSLKLPRLPFPDRTFDVVLCSEVFEHLVQPIESIAELLRIAKRYVVLTTLEGLSRTWWERALSHFRVDVRVPHIERNFLVLDEFEAVFGPMEHECLHYFPDLPANPLADDATQVQTYASLGGVDEVVEALCRGASTSAHQPGSIGILIAAPVHGAEIQPATHRDRELARWLVAQAAIEEKETLNLLGVHAVLQTRPDLIPADARNPNLPVASDLLGLLCCPDCRAPLVNTHPPHLDCTGCKGRFESEYGVPILYPKKEYDEPSETIDLAGFDAVDPARAKKIRRIVNRLRRNEAAPGRLRRAAWRLERWLGMSPDHPASSP